MFLLQFRVIFCIKVVFDGGTLLHRLLCLRFKHVVEASRVLEEGCVPEDSCPKLQEALLDRLDPDKAHEEACSKAVLNVRADGDTLELRDHTHKVRSLDDVEDNLPVVGVALCKGLDAGLEQLVDAVDGAEDHRRLPVVEPLLCGDKGLALALALALSRCRLDLFGVELLAEGRESHIAESQKVLFVTDYRVYELGGKLGLEDNGLCDNLEDSGNVDVGRALLCKELGLGRADEERTKLLREEDRNHLDVRDDVCKEDQQDPGGRAVHRHPGAQPEERGNDDVRPGAPVPGSL